MGSSRGGGQGLEGLGPELEIGYVSREPTGQGCLSWELLVKQQVSAAPTPSGLGLRVPQHEWI